MLLKKILLLLIILIAAVSLSNCGKDNPTKYGAYNYIIGHWEWVETIGGIAGVHITPENTGNRQMLIFMADGVGTGVRQYYLNDSMINETMYKLTTASWDNEHFYDAVDYSGVYPTQFYSFSERYDTLYLSDFIIDGFNYVYVRVR